MKKLLLYISFLLVVKANSQTPQAPIIFTTVTQMLSYTGSYYQAWVKDTLRGGLFTGIINGTQTADGGVILQGTGRQWIRQTTQAQAINIEWFGALPDNSTDNTTAIQNTIDYVDNTGGGTVYVPQGIFKARHIILRTGVRIIGDNRLASTLNAMKVTETDTIPYGFIQSDIGAVTNSGFSFVSIWGNGTGKSVDTALNPHQIGVYLLAQFDSANVQGGVRNSIFEDFNVLGFHTGWWSRGGWSNANGLLPNQHMNIIKPDIEVQAGGTGMMFTGQHGQIYIQGGKCKGFTGKIFSAYDVYIGRDPAPLQVAKQGAMGEDTTGLYAGTGQNTKTPSNMVFFAGFGPQNSAQSVYNFGGQNITFSNCWFENCFGAFTLAGKSYTSMYGNRFANAADSTLNPDSTAGDTTLGYLIKLVGTGGLYTWDGGNYIAGTAQTFLQIDTSITINRMLGANYPNVYTRYTTDSGFFPQTGQVQLSIMNDSVDAVGFDDIFLTATNLVRLKTVVSKKAPGQTIIFKVAASPVTVVTTGNIISNATSEVTFGAGNTIILERHIGSSSNWILVSNPNIYASAVPTDSFYYAKGTIIINSNGSGVGQPIGWKCFTAGYAGADAVFQAFFSLNGLTNPVQTFATGTAGSDFAISSSSGTGIHTFNLPDASTSARGVITTSTQSFIGVKNFTSGIGLGSFAGQTTLISGTKAISISGLTTGSLAFVQLVSQGGTSTTVYNYKAVCTANTLTITAVTTAGALVNTDTSVLNYEVFP